MIQAAMDWRGSCVLQSDDIRSAFLSIAELNDCVGPIFCSFATATIIKSDNMMMPALDVLDALEFVELDRDSLYSVFRTLDLRDLVSAAGVSRALRFPVESVLRERTMERGYVHPVHIPPGFVTWISLFAWLEYKSLQLDDTRISERQYALRRLGERLEPSVLAGYAPAVVSKFEDNDWRVRLDALETLGKLDPDVIAKYAPAVERKLEDIDWSVRCAALVTLRKLKPSVLNLYAIAIARQIDETALEGAGFVRCAALKTLCQLDASALESYAPVVVRLLHDLDCYVRLEALRPLCKLELNRELSLSVCATLENMVHGDNHGRVRRDAALLLRSLPRHELQN